MGKAYSVGSISCEIDHLARCVDAHHELCVPNGPRQTNGERAWSAPDVQDSHPSGKRDQPPNTRPYWAVGDGAVSIVGLRRPTKLAEKKVLRGSRFHDGRIVDGTIALPEPYTVNSILPVRVTGLDPLGRYPGSSATGGLLAILSRAELRSERYRFDSDGNPPEVFTVVSRHGSVGDPSRP